MKADEKSQPDSSGLQGERAKNTVQGESGKFSAGCLEKYFTVKLLKDWNRGPKPGESAFGGFQDLVEQTSEQPGLNLVFDHAFEQSLPG